MFIQVWKDKYSVPSVDFLVSKTNKYSRAKDWYKLSREMIAEVVDDTNLFIDLLAATSPRNSVKVNVGLARRTYNHIKANRSMSKLPHFGLCNGVIKDNVIRANKGMPLQGPKVSAFASALKGNEQAITIDTWIMKAFNLPRTVPTKRDRECINTCIRIIANRLAMTPAQTQACLWVYAKTELNDTPYKEVFDFSVYMRQRTLW